jgi:hypothetical protein
MNPNFYKDIPKNDDILSQDSDASFDSANTESFPTSIKNLEKKIRDLKK